MANYQGRSHYTHEIDQKYLDGWDAIFGKKKNPGAVDVKVHTTDGEENSERKSAESSSE